MKQHRYHGSASHDNASNFRRRMQQYKKAVQDKQRVTEHHVLEIPILPAIKRVK